MKNYRESEDLEHSDTEITLGTRSILGIFFGLVLVCGVFFGFGYSLGRGNAARAAASPQAAPEVPETTSPSSVNTVVEEPTTSNSAAATPQSKPTAAAPVPPPATEPASTAGLAPVQPTQTSYNPSTPAKATPAAYPIPAAANPSASIMVQIAAVSHRQDADVLVSALQKLGYSASVRSQADDNLLHVQIGPFATRDQAKVMRAKLLNDGYNAILK
jgi:DedD protein